jgi:hypothetical protein
LGKLFIPLGSSMTTALPRSAEDVHDLASLEIIVAR